MNYYNPSYYMGGYPYNNQYPLPSQQPLQPSYQMSNQLTPQSQSLNGKIVDSEDMVRATEVPIGGYGIFPKADLSEIYIKSWNNNGTTSVITFRPIVPEPPIVQENNGELTNLLLQKIEVLENKLDMFLAPQEQHQSAQQTKKTEVSKNGF